MLIYECAMAAISNVRTCTQYIHTFNWIYPILNYCIIVICECAMY